MAVPQATPQVIPGAPLSPRRFHGGSGGSAPPPGEGTEGASLAELLEKRDWWRAGNLHPANREATNHGGSSVEVRSAMSSAGKGLVSELSVGRETSSRSARHGGGNSSVGQLCEVGSQKQLDAVPIESFSAGGNWPPLGSSLAKKAPSRWLTLAPFSLGMLDQGGFIYYPSTEGGKQRVRDIIAKEIKHQLFRSPGEDNSMRELEMACCELEASMKRMNQVQWGSSSIQTSDIGRQAYVGGWEVEDAKTDIRFNHSWFPSGLGPSTGWY